MAIYTLTEAMDQVQILIEAKRKGFRLDTEFGRLVIEIVPYNYPLWEPVEVTRWVTAPETRFTSALMNTSADFYISIGDNGKSPTYRRIHIITALLKALLLSCVHGADDIPEDILDGAVTLYLQQNEGKVYPQAYLEREFKSTNLDRYRRAVLNDDLFTRNMTTRMMHARRVMLESEVVLKQYRNSCYSSSPDFKYIENIVGEGMLGIILYIASRNEAVSLKFERETYKMVVHETRTIDISSTLPSKETKLLQQFPTLKTK